MTRHRALAVVLGAIALAAMLPETAHAQSLDDAQKRLSELENKITTTEANAQRLQSQLRTLGAQVGQEQGNLLEIRTDLSQTNERVNVAKARLAKVQGELHDRARHLYKRGRIELIGVLLGGASFSDFVERVTYASNVAKRDEQIILDIREEKAELEIIQNYQVRLEREQRSTVESLERRRDQITDVFAEQQLALAELAEARAEALQLIDTLAAQLSGSELAALKRVAGRGMTVSYGEWAEAFLRSIGAPVVRANLVAVVAWEASEGTQATWNPLATTLNMPGATVYNSHNVRNYVSMEQGLDASYETLLRPNHGYEKILDSLERGAKAMDTGKAINASDWCAGCAQGSYVIGLIPAVEKYYERYSGE